MADISTPIKVVFVLLGLGFFIHLIGWSAPYWHVHEMVTYAYRTKTYYGVWKWCYEEQRYRTLPYDFCYSLVSGKYAGADYIRATQFFETVGFLAGLASIVLLLLAVCIKSCQDRRILPILSGVVALLAGGSIILGCIIFGAKDIEKDHLSWAFALAIIGGLFFGVAGILTVVATVVIKR